MYPILTPSTYNTLDSNTTNSSRKIIIKKKKIRNSSLLDCKYNGKLNFQIKHDTKSEDINQNDTIAKNNILGKNMDEFKPNSNCRFNLYYL